MNKIFPERYRVLILLGFDDNSWPVLESSDGTLLTHEEILRFQESYYALATHFEHTPYQ